MPDRFTPDPDAMARLRNRYATPEGGGAGGGTTPPPATTPPAPTTTAPVPPQWKTDLWNQYKSEGKPGDWQAYWRSHRGGAPTPTPTGPAPGPTQPPAPMAPLNPAVPPGQPATPEQMFPALATPDPGYGMPYQQSMPGDFNDPYNAYLSAIPVMETIRDQEISQAMAKAGFGGNRYSTSAMNTAGRIGQDTSNQLNQMLNTTMYNQAQTDLDRALQASGMGMQLGSLQDEIQRNKLNQLFGFGQYEQGRQDNFANLAYSDWDKNKLGYLPYLIQAFSGTGNPTPGTPVQTVTNPGTPPKIPPELLTLIAGFFS
jgi:hypothetical protein